MSSDSCLRIQPVECSSCPLSQGLESSSLFCPFIVRQYEAGTELYAAGAGANYVYYVMDGVVGLHDPAQSARTQELRLPGSIVGAECVHAEHYEQTATVLTPATMCGASREGFSGWLAARERAAVAQDKPRGTKPQWSQTDTGDDGS